MMPKSYFEEKKGMEILAATDFSGRVEVAIYSHPHIMADGSIASIIGDRFTICNSQSNPSGIFLFIEIRTRQWGERLFLKNATKIESGTDQKNQASQIQ